MHDTYSDCQSTSKSCRNENIFIIYINTFFVEQKMIKIKTNDNVLSKHDIMTDVILFFIAEKNRYIQISAQSNIDTKCNNAMSKQFMPQNFGAIYI